MGSLQSKEAIENSGSSQENLPDDLIILILLRYCSLKFIFRFKCVSRKWDRYLSGPLFRDAYISSSQKKSQDPTAPPLLGFLRMAAWSQGGTTKPGGIWDISFQPTNNSIEKDDPVAARFNFEKRVGHFRCLSSTTGLVLCGDYPNFHVLNPILRQSFSLPRPCLLHSYSQNGYDQHYFAASASPSPGFLLNKYHLDKGSSFPYRCLYNIGYSSSSTCQRRIVECLTLSPGFLSSVYDNDFKVIVPIVRPNFLSLKSKFEFLVERYSSSTGIWEGLKLLAADSFKFDPQVLSTNVGGTVFWYTPDGVLIAYDPDRNNDRVQLIKLPVIRGSASLCQSSNEFLQCAVNDEDWFGFRVYTLHKSLASYGYDEVISPEEWILKYDIRLGMLQDAALADIGMFFPYHQHGPCFVPMGFHPLYPLMLVVKIGNRFFFCDVENRLLNLIFEDIHSNPEYLLLPYMQPRWPPSPLPKDV